MVATARADDATDARAAYQRATAHFAVGEFALAADAYQDAYKLKQDPALLFNAAQSRRLAGENERALVLYRNYLQLYPKSRNAEEVRDQIAKLQEAVAAAEKAKNSQPTGTVEPARPMGNTEPPPVTPPPPVAHEEPPPVHKEPPTPIYKKWWLWTAVGVVVVAAVVIPVAVIESQPGKWGNVPDQSFSGLAVRW